MMGDRGLGGGGMKVVRGVKEVGVKMDAQQGNNLPPHGAKYEYHEAGRGILINCTNN